MVHANKKQKVPFQIAIWVSKGQNKKQYVLYFETLSIIYKKMEDD